MPKIVETSMLLDGKLKTEMSEIRSIEYDITDLIKGSHSLREWMVKDERLVVIVTGNTPRSMDGFLRLPVLKQKELVVELLEIVPVPGKRFFIEQDEGPIQAYITHISPEEDEKCHAILQLSR